MAVRSGPRVLVGRDEQLLALAETFDAVGRGRSTTVLLGGDAGVGKTTLVNAFVAQLAGARVIRGQCVQLGGDGLAFAPISGALPDLKQQVGDDAASVHVSDTLAKLGVSSRTEAAAFALRGAQREQR